MIKYTQLRDEVRKVLAELGKAEPRLNTPSAVALVMLTAAQESIGGYYIKQLRGPAQGIFQVEPETEKWILTSINKHQPAVMDIVLSLRFPNNSLNNLVLNLAYQIAMCRLRYFLAPGALPDADDIDGLAQYWKRHYNTSLGKGKWEDAKAAYIKYAKG